MADTMKQLEWSDPIPFDQFDQAPRHSGVIKLIRRWKEWSSISDFLHATNIRRELRFISKWTATEASWVDTRGWTRIKRLRLAVQLRDETFEHDCPSCRCEREDN